VTPVPDLTRRSFLRTAVVGGAVLLSPPLLAACGGDDEDTSSGSSGSGGADQVGTARTQLAWVKNVEFSGMWVADDKGFFTDEGVGVEWFAGGPNAPTAESVVAGGTADVGMTTFFEQLIDGIVADDRLVMFGTQFQTSPLGLISPADAPVRTPEDLLGKRIGGNTGNERYIETIFKVNGLDPDYEFVPIGFDPQPLVEGAADVVFGFNTNQTLILQEQGYDEETVLLSEFGLPAYANVFFAQRSYIDDNRDVLVRYMRALARGWELSIEQPDLGAELAVNEYGSDLGLSLDQQKKENRAQQELMQSDLTRSSGLFRMSADFLSDQVYPWLSASGRSELPDLAVSFDDSILAEVYADGPTVS
jgi:ABC-type nitrate/sulfonate/bicarbonate transport system substrate-binding protein